MPSLFLMAQARSMFPDVCPHVLSSLVQPRRRSQRILQQEWGAADEQAEFHRQVTEAMQSEWEVRCTLEQEASKWTELNQLRRAIYVEFHEFLSSFEQHSPRFSAELKRLHREQRRIRIDDAVQIFIDSGACPSLHVQEVAKHLERVLRLLTWRGGFYLEVKHPKKRSRSNYQVMHRVSWDHHGAPSACLEEHQSLEVGQLQALMGKVSGTLADAILEERGGQQHRGDDDEVCAICLDGFSEGEAVTRLECGHRFHTGCLRGQLVHAFTDGRPLQCGLCRGQID